MVSDSMDQKPQHPMDQRRSHPGTKRLKMNSRDIFSAMLSGVQGLRNGNLNSFQALIPAKKNYLSNGTVEGSPIWKLPA
ncbi:UNVERIFIED_CONTAM: hypothetical protein PYX00_009378 [Menopon gallinae]|uniref:Uncharacterized protein n=1 Tax=Menopon gallinae TaxID=328185 RepID=A0AAW2HBQ7_9NEOP